MQIKGLGGTDFQSVFKKVDALIKSNEFINLKGLFYSTDSYGEYPEKKLNYDTIFVFINDEYNNPGVPLRAIKLILKKMR